jgi:hypothetical protein
MLKKISATKPTPLYQIKAIYCGKRLKQYK